VHGSTGLSKGNSGRGHFVKQGKVDGEGERHEGSLSVSPIIITRITKGQTRPRGKQNRVESFPEGIKKLPPARANLRLKEMKNRYDVWTRLDSLIPNLSKTAPLFIGPVGGKRKDGGRCHGGGALQRKDRRNRNCWESSSSGAAYA